jgi:ABC-type phosphate/phosphonate transport system substrate-binding protein
MDKTQRERIQSALAAIDGSSEFENNFLRELKLDRLVAADDGDYAEFRDYYQKLVP